MLDIKLIRENKDLVKKDLEKRKDKESLKLLDELIKQDEKWRKVKYDVQKIIHEKNEASQEINKLKKAGKDAKAAIKKTKELAEKVAKETKKVEELKQKRDAVLMHLPNITHKSVPYGESEKDNKVIKEPGKKPSFKFDLKNHEQLAEELQIAEFDRATKISGAGFYFLQGDLALLNQALIRFAIDKMLKKGYSLAEVPAMMRRKPYEGVVDLADFENVMYKIENEDSYLIATSEHPLTAQFMDEILPPSCLPIRICGVSQCFRREIGSHGIDEKGLFRVHQFTKVEQIIICKPDQSWKFHEEMIKNAEEIFKDLGLPYRIVNICTSELGTVAAKKYDIEVWFPRTKEYKEVVSGSNCTDYQARRLNIKFGNQNEKELVHTLNCTAVATARALQAILENFQNKDGSVSIPKVLQKYMNGKTKLVKGNKWA